MSEDPPLPAIERDFDAIEAAVMQTDRGRWFLAEFQRRNRVADTQLLLQAITRLDRAVGEPEARAVGHADLAGVEAAFGSARDALAEGTVDGALPLSRLFGRMIRVSRGATADMLDAVERVQEAAWSLREAGATPSLCDELDGCAVRILQAAAKGTVTETRGEAVRAAILAVEDRLDAFRRDRLGLARTEPEAEAADAEATLPVRASPDRDMPAFLAGPSPASAPSRPGRTIPPSLAAIDAIEFRQRLKLFT